MRDYVIFRHSFCVLCGETDKDLLVDHHIIPKEMMGGNEPENLLTLCRNCHTKVHAWQSRGIPLLMKLRGQPIGYYVDTCGELKGKKEEKEKP